MKISEQEFCKIIDKNRLKLYKTAISIVKNEDDANDAIQDALYSAYKNLNSLREPKYFLTWLTRILINKCYDILKKKTKSNEVQYLDEYKYEEESYLAFDNSDNIDNKICLNDILDSIDEDLRNITVLYYYDEFSVSQISKILDIPTGTVKSRLSRARKQLMEKLQ